MFGNTAGDMPESGKALPPLLLPVPEVARLLGGVTERYVWQLIRTGELPAKLLGRRRLVEHAALQEFVRSLKDAEETARTNALA